MIWLIFAAVTAAALALVVRPLATAAPALGPVRSEADFYRDQLAEIERDLARGLLNPQDAETARIEAARRLLAASPSAPAPDAPAVTPFAPKVVAVVVLLAATLFSFGLYYRLGHPGRPDLPLAARQSDDPTKLDVATAVAKVEEHLRRNPNDGRGYDALGPVYMRMERYADAARAYREAARLLGETPERLAAQGEAEIFVSNGVVSSDTRRTLERALALDAANPRALYYLGLAAEQDGDKPKALSLYERILAAAPADAPGLAGVRRRVAALKGEDPAAAIASLPKEQQSQAIRSMVERLASRLSENGQDAEGWLRLVRAWSTLGERDRAKAALTDARKALAADAKAVGDLDALARELGLEG